jgi:hypothetical protein
MNSAHPLRRFAFRLLLPAALAFAAFAAPARAQLIVNGGFESPGFTPSPDFYVYLTGANANAITGWTNTWNGTGEPTYWMTLGGGYNNAIVAGSYAVEFSAPNILSTNFSVISGQTYTASFLAQGGAGVGTLQVTANGQSANFNPTPGVFNTHSYNFTANTTGTVSLSFQLSAGYVALDNVSVTAVPEPATYAAMLGVGALGLAAWRRRHTAGATNATWSAAE